MRVSGTVKRRVSPTSFSPSISPKCSTTSPCGALRDAGQHDPDGGAVLLGALEHLPDLRVGVAGGGGDAQPQVGGGHQLGRELVVVLEDRVEVGAVEQRQAGRQRLAGDDDELVAA